jgi:hypothetical protein
VIVPISSLQKGSKVAVLVIPLVLVVLLSAPSWLLWPFLNNDRRTAVLQFLGQLIEWIKVVSQVAASTRG